MCVRAICAPSSQVTLPVHPVGPTGRSDGTALVVGGGAAPAPAGAGLVPPGYQLSLTLLLQSMVERLQQRADLYGQMVKNSELHMCRQRCGWKGPA